MSEDNGLLSFNELDKIMRELAKADERPSLDEMAKLTEQLKQYGLDMDINTESGGKIDIDIADINIIEVAAIFSEILKFYVEREPHLQVDARLSLFSPGKLPDIESQEQPQEEPKLFLINRNLLILHYNWESAVNFYFKEIAPNLFNQRSILHQWDSLSGQSQPLETVLMMGPNDEPLNIRQALHEGFISVPDYIEME